MQPVVRKAPRFHFGAQLGFGHVRFKAVANLAHTTDLRRIADWQHLVVTRLYAIESQMAKAAVPVPTSL